MARYRRLYPRLWHQLQPLDDGHRVVALYCLSGPQSNRIGLFRLSPALAAEDLGTLPRTFLERLSNVCRTFEWRFDEGARVLWIPSWWEWNRPENKNVLISLLSDLEEIPQTALAQEFSNHVATLPQTLRDTFAERCLQRLPEPSPNQEQDHEQVQEQEQEASSSEPQAAPEPESPPVCEFPVVGSQEQKTWMLTEAKLAEWASSFPGLDVRSEIRSALQWTRDNPAKRKTARGMTAFLGKWLTNANDKRGARGEVTPLAPADVSDRVEWLAGVFADKHQQRRGAKYVTRPNRDVEALVALCRGYSDEELTVLVDGYMRAKGQDYDEQPRSPGRMLDKASVIEERLKQLGEWPKSEAA